MLTYQCSFCFYFCDLNLEVIEIFQANNYCLPEWKKTLYHLPMEISGNLPPNFWSNGKRPITQRLEFETNFPDSRSVFQQLQLSLMQLRRPGELII